MSLSLLGQVDAGEVDMALLIRPPFTLPPELGWQPLLREEVVLAMPAAMAPAPWREVLAAQPFIRYDRASFGGRVVDLFLKKQRITVHEAVELAEKMCIRDRSSRCLACCCCICCAAASRP